MIIFGSSSVFQEILAELKLNNKISENIAYTLDVLLDEVGYLRFQLYRPGLLQLIPLKQIRMDTMSVIQFKVVLPKVEDFDVVSRELSVQVGEGVPSVVPVAADAVEVTDLSGKEGVPVKLALVDIDNAGNRSEASTLEVTLADTFAPAKPGEMSVVATGELPDPVE